MLFSACNKGSISHLADNPQYKSVINNVPLFNLGQIKQKEGTCVSYRNVNDCQCLCDLTPLRLAWQRGRCRSSWRPSCSGSHSLRVLVQTSGLSGSARQMRGCLSNLDTSFGSP